MIMLTTDEILTLPKEIQGAAWLLLQKSPNVTLGALGKLARCTVDREDSDMRLTEKTRQDIGIPVDACSPMPESHQMPFVATRPVTDQIIAIMPAVALLLAQGHTQAECARLLGVSRSHVNHLVTACRASIDF